jgi:fatty-acyl-CoA synthase
VAAYLQQRLGVQHGDRVLLISQNCPQFVVAFSGHPARWALQWCR